MIGADGPLLSDIQREQNEQEKQRLVAFIRQYSPALIVGAGCSVACGYPTWTDLLGALERDAGMVGGGYPAPSEPSLLVRAQRVKEHYQHHNQLDRYYSVLTKHFGPDGHDRYSDVHRSALSLPIRGVVTPNYDCCVEAALEEMRNFGVHSSVDIDEDSRGVIKNFCDSLAAANGSIHVAHIHGSWRRIGGLVLTLQDYSRTYDPEIDGTDVREKAVPGLLGSVLYMFRALFIGFGLEDEYLMRIINAVARRNWRQGQATHYAVVGVGPGEAVQLDAWKDRMLGEFGISLVAYENPDGTHRLLRPFLDEMARACGTRTMGILDLANAKAIDGMAP